MTRWVFFCLLLALPAWGAVGDPNERLADPAKEALAREIGRELRCLVCQKGLVGEAGALEHAKSTGHANFCEFK